MKYTVTINEKSKTVTVNLNGYEGVAKCCATDTFNLQTGIELALERARVAEANAKKPKPAEKPMSVMELVKALEKALPKGQMVIVGNGANMTEEQKRWLRSLAGGCDCKCECNEDECYTDEEIDDMVNDAYDEGYEKGYDEGYNDAYEEIEEQTIDENDVDLILEKIKGVLADVLDI
jgi:flagellar biosynthesis/type III secretory pathway protein FliH